MGRAPHGHTLERHAELSKKNGHAEAFPRAFQWTVIGVRRTSCNSLSLWADIIHSFFF
jgi:hypothetical protein